MSNEGFEKNPVAPQEQPLVPETSHKMGEYEQVIHEKIGDQWSVQFTNINQFTSDKSRFLFGFTESPENKSGFIKLCKTEDLKTQLKREVLGMALAEQLGARTVGIIDSYQESSNGSAFVHLEALNSEQGTALHSPELIAGADAQLGGHAADAIVHLTAREIPPTQDTSFLKRIDGRNQSVESFWHTWESAKEKVLESLSGDEKIEIQTIISGAEEDLKPLLAIKDTSGKEYFVHNDTSPGNIFFNGTEKNATLLDFEHAGATSNQYLAMITDIGNFYGRTWPNPEMQRVFSKTILEKVKSTRTAEGKTMVRGAMVFGAIYLAQFGVNKDHKEHAMTKSLLQNIKTNLDTIFPPQD